MNGPAAAASVRARERGIAEPGPEDVARIAPVIAAAADEAERARRLPPALLDALHGAALFRLLLPRRFGGAETPLPRYMAVVEAVAKVDGSAAWCLGQGNGCAMAAGSVDPAVAEEIWGADPRAVLAWGPGKGPRRAGGRRVSRLRPLVVRQRNAPRHLARRHGEGPRRRETPPG